MNGNRVTITDVARLADVSVSTVSNLLNGRDERMRPSTKERILAAIEELGYTPNQAARQLKTGQTSILGLIVPSVANPFYGVFAREVEKAALDLGYQVLLGNSERDAERERLYAEELWSYGVRGIIFGSSLMAFSHLDDLIRRGLRVVAFDRPGQAADRAPMDSISVDNVQAARLAIKHLLALGHRRIGFVSGPIRTVSRLDRLEGYRSALEEAGIPFDPQLVWQGVEPGNFGDSNAVDLGRQGAHELLSLSDPPTALFTVNDMYAFGAYAGARDLGRRIPQDLSVVGFDDIVLSQIVEPPLTTIRQPVAEISRLAVERLVERLQNNGTHKPGHITLPAQLIVRASTAPVSG
ncbi:MAG: LacI family transcriptional regulator [Caldilineae bacterium]|nr:MAG: LacI family transcriptional regulator [Caldilineae bacterium]